VRPQGYSQVAYNEDEALPGPLDFAVDPNVVASHYSTMMQELEAIPTVSITLPVQDLFGSAHGIYTHSDTTFTNSAEEEVPDDPLGDDWKRSVTVEYFVPGDGNSYVQEAGVVRISGGSSRRHANTSKHNLRLSFEAKTAVTGSIGFDFNSAPFINSPREVFTQILFRNPTHDSWAYKEHFFVPGKSYRLPDQSTYVRDAWTRQIHHQMHPRETGSVEPAGNWIANRRWIHLFLNGLYWGVYEMGERIDESFCQVYGDATRGYDVIKQNGEEVDGEIAAYNYLIQLCQVAQANQDPGDPGDSEDPVHQVYEASWASVEGLLDVDNYIDYMILNFYMDGTDWPTNNWRAVRRREGGSKFKFLVWDAEISMWDDAGRDPWDGNAAPPRNPTLGAAEIFGILQDHPEFEAAFKARVQRHFYDVGGVFKPDDNVGILPAALIFETEALKFQGVIHSESARWGDANQFKDSAYTDSDPSHLPGEVAGDWNRSVALVKDDYIYMRRDLILQHFRDEGLAD
jgi:hypothetical protein